MIFSADILFFKKYRLLWHILFWTLAVVFFTLFFGHQGKEYSFTLYFVLLLIPITMGTTYFFMYFLIPKFLFKERYALFALLSVYTFIVSVFLETMTVFVMLFFFMYGNGPQLDSMAIDLYLLVVGMYFVVILAVSVKLLKLWFEKQRSALTLERQKLQTELNMLKSQIHPHFLFNTLNNIYALTLNKSDEAPEMLVRLSEILHYLLYECSEEMVPLEREMEMLGNYIELERIRYGERLELSEEFGVNPGKVLIAPMLLLPFVENAFKHGAARQRDRISILIHLSLENDRLSFRVENSKRSVQDEDREEKSHGLGLANVRQRLEMLYPGKYDLSIKDTGTRFLVSLSLEILNPLNTRQS